MIKNETKAFFKELGYSSSYSGNTRTLFVHGISTEELKSYTLHTDFAIIAD